MISDLLKSYSVEELSMIFTGASAIFAGISTLIVLIGTLIALWNLRIIAKTSRLEAFDAFEKRWDDMKDLRHRILEDFFFDPANPPSLSSELGQEIRQVINNINVVGSMVEKRLLPPALVFGLCYPDFIRFEHRLRGYLIYRGRELGITYGARVGRMAKRAKRYHDLRHPKERVKVKGQDGRDVVVYQSERRSGLANATDRIEARYRQLFGRW